MLLHSNKKIMLSNIIFDKRNLRRANTLEEEATAASAYGQNDLLQ